MTLITTHLLILHRSFQRDLNILSIKVENSHTHTHKANILVLSRDQINCLSNIYVRSRNIYFLILSFSRMSQFTYKEIMTGFDIKLTEWMILNCSQHTWNDNVTSRSNLVTGRLQPHNNCCPGQISRDAKIFILFSLSYLT